MAKGKKKEETVKINVEITEAIHDDGRQAVWLEGTFSVRVPKPVAEKLSAPPSFEVIQVEAPTQ